MRKKFSPQECVSELVVGATSPKVPAWDSILLDTNAIFGDHFLARPTFEAIVASQEDLGLRVLIPEVVVQEHVRHYADEVSRELKSLTTCCRKLSRRLKVSGIVEQAAMDAQTVVRGYEDALRRRAEQVGVKVIPVPRVPNSVTLSRDLGRLRPFCEAGTGYRDWLIWNSCLEMLQGNAATLLLVTANTSDFLCKSGGLHEDLCADLDTLGIERDRVGVARTLEEAYNSCVAPGLALLEDVTAALLREEWPKLSLVQWGVENLNQCLYERSSEQGSPALPEGFRAAGFLGVNMVELRGLSKVRRISTGELIVAPVFQVSCLYQFYIERSHRRQAIVAGFCIEREDELTGTLVASRDVSAQVDAKLLVDETSGVVTSAEIVEVFVPAVGLGNQGP